MEQFFNYPIDSSGELALFCLETTNIDTLRMTEESRRAFIATAEAVAERATIPTLSAKNIGTRVANYSLLSSISMDRTTGLMWTCPEIFHNALKRQYIGFDCAEAFASAEVFRETAIGAFNLFFSEETYKLEHFEDIDGSSIDLSVTIKPFSIGFIEEMNNPVFTRLSDRGQHPVISRNDDFVLKVYTGLSEAKWSGTTVSSLGKEGYAWYDGFETDATRWLKGDIVGAFNSILAEPPAITDNPNLSVVDDYCDSWSVGNRPDFSDDIASTDCMMRLFRNCISVNFWSVGDYSNRYAGPLRDRPFSARRPAFAMAVVQRMLYDIRNSVCRMAYRYLFVRRRKVKTQSYKVTFDGTEFKIVKNGSESESDYSNDKSYYLDEELSTTGTEGPSIAMRWVATIAAPWTVTLSDESAWKTRAKLDELSAGEFGMANDAFVSTRFVTSGMATSTLLDGWNAGDEFSAESSASLTYVDSMEGAYAQNEYPASGSIAAGYVGRMSMTFFERIYDEITDNAGEEGAYHFVAATSRVKEFGVSNAWKSMAEDRGRAILEANGHKGMELKVPENKDSVGREEIEEAYGLVENIELVYKIGSSLEYPTPSGDTVYAPYAIRIHLKGGGTRIEQISYSYGFVGSISEIVYTAILSLFKDEFVRLKQTHWHSEAIGCIQWNWKTF